MSLNRTFAALQHRNYRLWFVGQLVSMVGTWMQSTAQGYLVFELTRSPAYLGYVGFAAGVPSWLFMLYGGVVADRMSRRNLLLITQTVMMILAFGLAGLTFSGLIQPWHLILLAFGLGVANAFDAPARQAFVLEMVSREDLTNAIALNSTMFNLATVIGPAVAGVAVDELKAGLRYVNANSPIKTLIGVAAMMSLFGMAYVTLIPAWAVTILGGDSATNGWLQSARGLGALAGALMIASLGHITFKGKLLTVGTFVFPLLLLGFAVVRWLPLSLLAMVGVGWGFMVLFNMANTLIQTLVDDDLRGRVVSLYTLSFFGLIPIGALLTGGLAELTSEPITIIVSALISLSFAGWLWWRMPQLRALE
jgi:MFS family permease